MKTTQSRPITARQAEIRRAIDACSGNYSAAARTLGISRKYASQVDAVCRTKQAAGDQPGHGGGA
jgi:hypothetical protein